MIAGVKRPAPGGNSPGTIYYAVSETGSLIYVPGPISTSSAQDDLARWSRDGALAAMKLPPAPYEYPRVSPDGARVAVGTNDAKDANVWIHDLSGASAKRQLTLRGRNRFPLWSPNGQRVAYVA